MTTNGFKIALTTVLIATTTMTAHGQNFDGIYQPDGYDWTCDADDIGMDGGALAIENGVLNGLESRCELTAPASVGNGIQYTAVCSAEGSTYREPMTIAPTANGVKIDSDGSTAYWRRCEAEQKGLQTPQAMNGRWNFGFGQGISESSTREKYGNSVAFNCDDLGENGGLYIELGGRPISGGQVTIEIDGQAYEMTAWADGGSINTECSVCGDNYMALWAATAAGNMMVVRASDGRSAAFSLHGSREHWETKYAALAMDYSLRMSISC